MFGCSFPLGYAVNNGVRRLVSQRPAVVPLPDKRIPYDVLTERCFYMQYSKLTPLHHFYYGPTNSLADLCMAGA